LHFDEKIAPMWPQITLKTGIKPLPRPTKTGLA
jgi:hypothetical protein